jgi:hypothetical protein
MLYTAVCVHVMLTLLMLRDALYGTLTYSPTSISHVMLASSIAVQNTHHAQIPIMLDYFNETVDESSRELIVNFDKCYFSNITFAGQPARPSIIASNGYQNRIVITDSYFLNNDMVGNNNTLVRTVLQACTGRAQ